MNFHQQGQASSQSTTPFYTSPSSNATEIRYSGISDAELAFQVRLDLPINYEPYPEPRQYYFGDISGHLLHQPYQQKQSAFLSGQTFNPVIWTSSILGKGKEPARRPSTNSGPKETDESLEKKAQRRFQNLLSQRAYRTRKDKLIETLQLQIASQTKSCELMADLCNKKIDSCIDVLNTQINELGALQTGLLAGPTNLEDTGKRDDIDEIMNLGREGSFEGKAGIDMGFKFDAGAWGYQS